MKIRAAGLAVLLLAGCSATPRPVPLSQAPIYPSSANGQLWSVPINAGDPSSAVLTARVCLPSGSGPWPVALLTHGSAPSPALRGEMQPAACNSSPVHWFNSQNFAVVSLLRKGFGSSTGPAQEDNGPCVAPDYVRSARLGAEDIEVGLRAAWTMPWAKPTGAVVVGQSTGGWAGLALAGMDDPRVQAVIAFAPGRGAKAYKPPESVCRADLLVNAARELGGHSTTPVLWIVARNDSYFPPNISTQLEQAFSEGRGQTDFVLVNPFFDEGHALYNAPGGSDVWGPIVQSFLSRLP